MIISTGAGKLASGMVLLFQLAASLQFPFPVKVNFRGQEDIIQYTVFAVKNTAYSYPFSVSPKSLMPAGLNVFHCISFF